MATADQAFLDDTHPQMRLFTMAKENEWTCSQLARYFNFDVSNMHKYWTGSVEMRLTTLMYLCDALDVDIRSLFPDDQRSTTD